MKARAAEGFSLMEVVFCLLLVSLLASALVRSVMMCRRLAASTCQQVAAFWMCKAKLEEVRALDYEAIAATNLVDEVDLPFGHLGGRDRLPLLGTRRVSITPRADPDAKEVQVSMAWTFRGVNRQEHVTGVIHPR